MTGEDPFIALAEELYGLTPGEFTAARNDYAKQLKDEGDRELADRVKSLQKPAMAAWVVNMLVRHDTDEMTQVLALGESLRQAQADLDGEALRELTRQRRRLISAMAGRGRTLAREHGQKVSESVGRQVEETLHAAMIDADAAAAVRTGLLVDPLSSTGLGSLKVASAVADHTALGRTAKPLSEIVGPKGSRKKSALRAVPESDPEERAREERNRLREEASATVDNASSELSSAQAVLAEAEQRVSDLQAGCLQVNAEIDELRRRLGELEDRLERLDEQAEAAAGERDEAAQAVAVAESALKEAKAELDRLSE